MASRRLSHCVECQLIRAPIVSASVDPAAITRSRIRGMSAASRGDRSESWLLARLDQPGDLGRARRAADAGSARRCGGSTDRLTARQDVEQHRQGFEPLELPAPRWRPGAARRARIARPVATTWSRIVGLDLAHVPRRADAPGAERRVVVRQELAMKRRHRAARADQGPEAVHPGLAAASSSRTSASSLVAGSRRQEPLGQEPLGDVAVVDVRAGQRLDQLVVARLRQVEAARRGVSL